MFGFHSLAPAKLYDGTQKNPAPKPKPDMGDTQSVLSSDAQAETHGNGVVNTKTTNAADENERPHHGQRDSGVSGAESIPGSAENQTQAPVKTGTELASQQETGSGVASPHQQQPTSHTQLTPPTDTENRTASIDFTNPPAEAGPSTIRAVSSRSSLQRDTPVAPPRPDESKFNAIAYRRDPETVIAYLVPLPQPTLQGSTLSTEPKYFLYAPPPPHLIKPAASGHEGYVRKLNRHWQQNVRRATRNAHNGRRVSVRGVHSKLVRGCTWGLDKLKADDVTFLARIHPTTVTHLILIHPSGLAGAQTPEQVMRTFRAQMFESKKRAKRDSILSAVFFMPALVIDTAAIFFGGLSEIDGIWMLVSVTAYRTAKFITKKMGPEPKTLELEQAKLIEDAKRSGFHEPEPEPEDKEPGAMRRSVDAMRRSLGSVKYRMSLNQRRSQSKKRRGGDRSSSDTSRPPTSRPQTTEAARSDSEGFSGGDLEHHAEENEEPATGAAAATAEATAAPASTGQSDAELSGFLEHMEEETTEEQSPSGGILAGTSDGNRTSGESSSTSKTKKGGQNFQLTFYPSPAMEVLAQYVQQSCHMRNGQAYASPTPLPTEEDVLAAVGWRPEMREHESAEQQADDMEWQTRAIKEDLRQTARKAAKAWNKSCRKQSKQLRRGNSSKKGGFLMGRRAKVEKGKQPTTTPTTDSETATPATEKKAARTAGIQARIAAVRAKAQRNKDRSSNNNNNATTETPATSSDLPQEAPAAANEKKRRGGRAAGAAALLCVPCFAVAERVKHRKAKDGTEAPAAQASSQEEKKSGASGLKQRLALRQRLEARKAKKATAATEGSAETQGPAGPVGLETPTDIDGPVGSQVPQQETTPVAGAATGGVAAGARDQTDAEEEFLQPENKSKKGRLLAIPAAIAAAIGAALSKRRSGKDKKATTTEQEATAKEAKPSRFSALQQRFKARRTRVAKKEPADKKPRSSGILDWFRELRQKRQAKKGNNVKVKKSKATKTSPDTPPPPKTAQEHGAVIGLLAGCFALPAGKVKQVRDKRRSDKTKTQAESSSSTSTAAPQPAASVVAGTPLTPVIEEQRSAVSASPSPATLVPSAEAQQRPATSYQAPAVAEDAEEYDDPPEVLPIASQFLPGHGQSEVPVSPERPALRTGTGTTGSASGQPQTRAQAASAAAGVKFKSMRDGLGNLANRRRGGAGEKAEEPRAESDSEPTGGEAAPTGRFQGLRGGLEGFIAKKRAPETAGSDAAVADNEQTKPSTEENAAAGGPFKSIKAGLGNMRAKKNETEAPPPNEKAVTEKSPGFVERMRWILLVA